MRHAERWIVVEDQPYRLEKWAIGDGTHRRISAFHSAKNCISYLTLVLHWLYGRNGRHDLPFKTMRREVGLAEAALHTGHHRVRDELFPSGVRQPRHGRDTDRRYRGAEKTGASL